MDAGLLFYSAHRTMFCQKEIADFISNYGIGISNVLVCTKESNLEASMSNLLYSYPIVFIVSETNKKRPDCSEHIFSSLNIKIKPDGEPKGIMYLSGNTKNGYLIESQTQAIILLPDIPNEISIMLPTAFKRLSYKFNLKQIKNYKADYESDIVNKLRQFHLNTIP